MSVLRRIGLAMSVLGSLSAGQRAGADELIPPARIDALAKPLVDSGWTYGLAIGLIDARGRQFIGYGRTSETIATPPAGDTEFEIGSITKTFTGILLAQAVVDKIVTLEDPVQKLLGDSMTVPQGERPITLVDLATHSSGLPSMPYNFLPRDMNNPFADYTVEQLAKFLGSHKLRREPGAQYEYSNLAMGLLGHALARQAGLSYEALVEQKICQPLAMHDTVITLNDSQRARLASGHDYEQKPVANWDLPTLAGAGAIRSTTNDMLTFLAANITPSGPTAAAIALSHPVRFKMPGPNDVALAWHVQRKPHIVWHNGQTGGYHTWAGFSPEKKLGVVVLSNTAGLYIDELGLALVDLLGGGDPKAFALPSAINLSAEELEPLVGKYQLAPQVIASITRKDDQLFVQLTGQPKLALVPSDKLKFFLRAVEASIDFSRDDAGQVTGLELHQAGQKLKAPRTAK